MLNCTTTARMREGEEAGRLKGRGGARMEGDQYLSLEREPAFLTSGLDRERDVGGSGEGGREEQGAKGIKVMCVCTCYSPYLNNTNHTYRCENGTFVFPNTGQTNSSVKPLNITRLYSVWSVVHHLEWFSVFFHIS